MTYSIKTHKQRPRVLVLAIIFVVLLAAVGFGARYYYLQNIEPVSSVEVSQVVTIEPGATTQQVAELLQDEGLIRSSWAFAWYMRSQNLREQIKTGSYALRPNMSVAEIAETITGGEVDLATFTILPERRLDEIRDSLINEGGFSPAEVDEALDPVQYDGHPALSDKPANANLEGYIYPETFQISHSTTAQDIIELSLDEMASYLSPTIREGIRAQGLTVHEGIILASIVEREVDAVNPDDRPRVAQVFYSRLDMDMELQSDATSGYGAALDGVEASLNHQTPYNTYQNTGLTPTPISNVTISSLRAVADPADTDFLYFVSGDRDENNVSVTYFSRTLEEHEEKTDLYCTELCQ